MNRALIVGINSYGGVNDLRACVADAEAMRLALARHKDGEKNFDCTLLPDAMEDGTRITRPSLRTELQRLFEFDGTVLFYFSGHGFLSPTGGLLCTSDAAHNDWGIPMQEVVDLAVQSPARENPDDSGLLSQRKHRQPLHDGQGWPESTRGVAGKHDRHRRFPGYSAQH